MWLLMVTMLATLDMSKASDEHGNTIEPDAQFNDSVFRCVSTIGYSHPVRALKNILLYRKPSPFKCSLLPRSKQAVKLIQQMEFES
jgi:hypothetical protein